MPALLMGLLIALLATPAAMAQPADGLAADEDLFELSGRPLVDAVYHRFAQQLPPARAVTLEPGDGFDGEAPEPMPTGSSRVEGHQATAIARWAVVPYQRFDDTFDIGVVAFHFTGIKHVAFSVNDGPMVYVKDMTINPRTGVPEYWVRLDAADLDDGLIEVRAVAVPNHGKPRLLAGPDTYHRYDDKEEHSLFLYANGDGSLEREVVSITPDTRIDQALDKAPDGAVIELQPGVYDMQLMKKPRSVDHWITLRPAPGVSREQVVIRAKQRDAFRPQGSKIHWQNLSFDFATISGFYTPKGDRHWFDNCHWSDSNGWDATYTKRGTPIHPHVRAYMTDCLVENQLYGAASMRLVRGCRLRKISGDCFQKSKLVLGSAVSDVDSDAVPHHTDILQYWSNGPAKTMSNVIVFGLRGRDVYSQHLFMRTPDDCTFQDFAFVDVWLDTGRREMPVFKSQLHCNYEHVLFKQFRSDLLLLLRYPGDARAGEGFRAQNVLFDDCVLPRGTWKILMKAPDGVTVRDLRIASPPPPGHRSSMNHGGASNSLETAQRQMVSSPQASSVAVSR